MGEINPNEPQVRDPELEAELVRTLSIVGPLGVLRVADIVIPTISMGNVVEQTVAVRSPVFGSTNVFSNGVQTAAPANTIHTDTGNLAAGDYDLQIYISPHTIESNVWFVQHRNAAGTANLAVWVWIMPINGPPLYQTIGYNMALNERLRIVNQFAFSAGIKSVATIFARRRN